MIGIRNNTTKYHPKDVIIVPKSCLYRRFFSSTFVITKNELCMTPDEVLTITISIPMENGIKHTHSVTFPYDGDTYDVLAEDALREFLVLMENVWGELAVENLLNKKRDS